jgi:pimeloyl-ACP methyl ester carboxylesterase
MISREEVVRIRLSALVVVCALCSPSFAFADEVVDGRLGPGSIFRLVRPTNWNGSLLVYAHGVVAREAPVTLPPEAELIISLVVPQGFAVAYSSFSENGWAVKDGAQRTHQLLGIFTSRFGAPGRVYLAGASMGGLIAIKLLEQYPGLFAGAVPACAAAGGTRAQYDYLAHTRALFDVFYPGILPGDAGGVPAGVDITNEIALPALAAMQSDGSGALAIASIDQTPIPFSNAAELFESIVTALVGHARSFSDLVPELHGKPYFDNRDVQYTGALPDTVLATINAAVGRFKASRSALNYMEHFYTPSGDLQIPMVMLSTSRDPVVPGFHQTLYGSLVAASGESELLVEREVDRYGHCNFAPAELAGAFIDLVLWVELGIKPVP